MMHTAVHATAYGNEKAVISAVSASEIAQTVSGLNNLVVVGNGLAIVSAVDIGGKNTRFAYQDGKVFENAELRRLSVSGALARLELEIVSVETGHRQVAGAFDYSAFVQAALLKQVKAIQEFLTLLVVHCANRSVADKKLSSIPSIQLRLAEVAKAIALIRALVSKTTGDRYPAYGQAANLIGEATNLLAKTAGARSMLSSGIVEMQFLFTLFNEIYVNRDDQY